MLELLPIVLATLVSLVVICLLLAYPGAADERVRFILFWLFEKAGWLPSLFRRTFVLEIGFSGHISDLDKDVAEKEGLKPLSRLERWMVDPFIRIEKEIMQAGWRKAVRETLGEDC